MQTNMTKFNKLQDEIDFFAFNEEIRVKVEKVGNEKVVIIDNFYKHPEKIQELALAIPSTRSPTLMHALPGSRVEATYYFGHFGDIIPQIIQKVFDEDSHLVDLNLVQDCLNHATFLVNVQESEEARNSPRVPHLDNLSDGRYAIGIYLNSPQDCTGGTAFYKFKGKQTVDLLNSVDPDLLAYDFYVQETDEHWEKIYLAEMKFNRLVMYKQNMLHTPYIPANSFTNETPRLIQMFFI